MKKAVRRLAAGTCLIACFAFASCNQSRLTHEPLDSRIQPIVDIFFREAFLRGVPLEFRAEEVRIQFGILDGRWGGSCKPNGQTPTITIDSVKWKHIDSLERELLVFHELAHCLLMRGHFNQVFAFGECKSLLREDISACHVNWRNPKWRAYYLDELFTPDSTTAPDWYNSHIGFPNVEDLSPVKRITLEDTKFRYFDTTYFSGFNDWVLEFSGLQPMNTYHHIGVRIDELSLETSVVLKESIDGETVYVPSLIIFDTYNPKKILSQSTSSSESPSVSLLKKKSAVYVFFDGGLEYILPIDPTKLKVGAYSSFPEDQYQITLYLPH